MNRTPGHGRRRSTRNKTVVIDSQALLQDTPDNAYGYENFSVLIKPRKPTAGPQSLIETRSYNFQDLMSAFHSIEKRSGLDPHCISDALKRFKSNEETISTRGWGHDQMRIEHEMFPKITNNPFLRNDFDIPVDRIEKEGKSKGNKQFGDRFNRPGQ